jgi:hypothetical protein
MHVGGYAVIAIDARQGTVKVIRARALPMAPMQFLCVLDAITTGLLFTHFQTQDLITEDVFVATLEALTW